MNFVNDIIFILSDEEEVRALTKKKYEPGMVGLIYLLSSLR